MTLDYSLALDIIAACCAGILVALIQISATLAKIAAQKEGKNG